VEIRLFAHPGRRHDSSSAGLPNSQTICTPCATFVARPKVRSYGPPAVPAHLFEERTRVWRTEGAGRAAARLGAVGIVSISLLATACSVTTGRGVQPLALQGSGHRPPPGGLGARAAGTVTDSVDDPATGAAILMAWRSAQLAFQSAALTADPGEPALTATTVDPQLSFTQALLAGMIASGEESRGPVDLGQPTVVAATSDEATVRSCLHDAEIVVSRASGRPVPGIEGRAADELVVSLMVRTEGVWKLSDQTVRESSCPTR
jgi:hypothetical protein